MKITLNGIEVKKRKIKRNNFKQLIRIKLLKDKKFISKLLSNPQKYLELSPECYSYKYLKNLKHYLKKQLKKWEIPY